MDLPFAASKFKDWTLTNPAYVPNHTQDSLFYGHSAIVASFLIGCLSQILLVHLIQLPLTPHVFPAEEVYAKEYQRRQVGTEESDEHTAHYFTCGGSVENGETEQGDEGVDEVIAGSMRPIYLLSMRERNISNTHSPMGSTMKNKNVIMLKFIIYCSSLRVFLYSFIRSLAVSKSSLSSTARCFTIAM